MRALSIDQRIEAIMGPTQYTAMNNTTEFDRSIASPNGASILCATGFVLSGNTNQLQYQSITRLINAGANHIIQFETTALGKDQLRVRVQNETGTQQNASESAMYNMGLRTTAGLHTAVFYLPAGHTSLSLWIDTLSTTVPINPGVSGIAANQVRIGGNVEILRVSAAWA